MLRFQAAFEGLPSLSIDTGEQMGMWTPSQREMDTDSHTLNYGSCTKFVLQIDPAVIRFFLTAYMPIGYHASC